MLKWIVKLNLINWINDRIFEEWIKGIWVMIKIFFKCYLNERFGDNV